jgi:hypothetical protein
VKIRSDGKYILIILKRIQGIVRNTIVNLANHNGFELIDLNIEYTSNDIYPKE